MTVSLASMKAGKSGIVVGLLGGRGFINRLNALGIRLSARVMILTELILFLMVIY